jgi:hypothetical protein
MPTDSFPPTGQAAEDGLSSLERNHREKQRKIEEAVDALVPLGVVSGKDLRMNFKVDTMGIALSFEYKKKLNPTSPLDKEIMIPSLHFSAEEVIEKFRKVVKIVENHPDNEVGDAYAEIYSLVA